MESAPYDPLGKPRQLLAAVYVITATAYLAWRTQTLNPEATIFSWLVYGAEFYGVVTMFLLLFMCWRLTRPVVTDPPDGLTIDVLVPSYDEPAEVVRRTLLAATRMAYPHQTWLLDDGNRPEMQALAERLGCRYLARSRNVDAKAGNLNNALKHSNADFVAVFDADHAPHPNFLIRTLGHFRNPNVAFVQTPQDFYNLDSYQHRISRKKTTLWTEQSLFFNVIQRGKDYWNSAFFCGSCAILRRSCLDSIGGFATGTVTEDLHTSLRLHQQGYKSVYHAEALAYGIAVLDADSFLRQRLRWGQGAMQVWRREKVLLNRKLSLPQRLSYFSSMVTYFDGWQRAVFYTVPAIVLISGILPINITVSQFLGYFIPYLAISLWTFGEITRGYGRSLYSEQYNFARFAVFCQSTFALFRRHLDFKVTEKKRASNARRSKLPVPQVAVFGLNLLAIPVGIYLYLQTGHMPLDALIANLFWCGVLIGVALSLLKFTSKNSAQRRQAYRFQIPVCGSITLEGQLERLVTVDNISSGGFGFHGKLPGRAETGQRITGHLYLPGGQLPFSAFIRSLREDDSVPDHVLDAVSCEFGLQAEDATEQLEAFLHGSDLQWHFLDVSEHTWTPLSALSGKPQLAQIPATPASRHWSCCTYLWPVQFDLKRFYGVVSMTGTDQGNTRYLIVTQPLQNAGTILVRPETYGNESVISASLASERHLRTADGSMYLYKLEDCRETTTWLDEAISA